MILVWTLLIGVASYRVWRMAAVDDVAARPIEWVLVRMPEWFNKMWRCHWCLGSWVAFAVTWLTDATVGLHAPVLVALAAAVVVGWLGENL